MSLIVFAITLFYIIGCAATVVVFWRGYTCVTDIVLQKGIYQPRTARKKHNYWQIYYVSYLFILGGIPFGLWQFLQIYLRIKVNFNTLPFLLLVGGLITGFVLLVLDWSDARRARVKLLAHLDADAWFQTHQHLNIKQLKTVLERTQQEYLSLRHLEPYASLLPPYSHPKMLRALWRAEIICERCAQNLALEGTLKPPAPPPPLAKPPSTVTDQTAG